MEFAQSIKAEIDWERESWMPDLSALLCECAKSIKVPVGQNTF